MSVLAVFDDLEDAVELVSNFLTECIGTGDPSGLEDLILTIPMISYYTSKMDEIALQLAFLQGKNELVTLNSNHKVTGIHFHDLDAMKTKPRKEFRRSFVMAVEGDLLGKTPAERAILEKFGISHSNAGRFFDYITVAKDPSGASLLEPSTPHSGPECGFTLGCAKKPWQAYFSIEEDHAFPKSWGGIDDPSNYQPMCKRHNMLKSNNILFDNLSFRKFLP